MVYGRRRCTSRRSVSACRDEPPWAGFVHAGNWRDFQEFLVALTQVTALKRDNWSPCSPRRRDLGHFDGRFRQLLCDSEQMLAPHHFAPHVLGPDPRRSPQHSKIIEKIG